MIRDPSDGSVREKPAPVELGSLPSGESELAVTPALAGAGTATSKESLQVPVIDTATSGLPFGSSKPENIARLEKSLDWLRDYRAGKFKQTDGERG